MVDAVWPSAPDEAPTETGSRSRAAAVPLPVITGLVAFLVYLGTVAPTIGFLDSPELSAAILSLGVPHPTGYPLFTLLGHLFATLLAWGDPAWRLNVFAALLASGAVGFTAAFAKRLTGRPLAGWVAGLALAFSPGFWKQATLLEVYGLHVALITALLYFWLRYERARKPVWLSACVLTAGLALTHHLMALLVIPLVLVALLAHFRRFARPRELAKLCVLGLAPLTLLAYLPWAASRRPIVDWGDPSTLNRFIAHVIGAQYHGLVGSGNRGSAWIDLFERMGLIAEGLTPVMWPLVVLGLVGAVRAAIHAFEPDVDPERTARNRAALLLGGVFASGAGFGVLYGAVDREPFFLNALWVVCVWAGLGAVAAVDWLGDRWPDHARWTVVVVALCPVVTMVTNVSTQDRSHDFEAHDSAMASLSVVPENSILLVEGPYGYPPIYASLIEIVRKDVLVVDQYLRVRRDGGGYGPELEALRRSPDYDPDTFDLEVARVAAELGRPLFIVPRAPDLAWDSIGQVRIREGAVDRLVPAGTRRTALGPPPRPDAMGTAAVFGEGLELLASTIDVDSPEPGDVIPVTLWWRDARANPAPELSVTLTAGDAAGWLVEDDEGEPVLSFSYPLGRGLSAVPGEGEAEATPFSETIHLVVPRALAEREVVLYLGVLEGEQFLATSDERVFQPLGAISVQRRDRPLWSLARSPLPL